MLDTIGRYCYTFLNLGGKERQQGGVGSHGKMCGVGLSNTWHKEIPCDRVEFIVSTLTLNKQETITSSLLPASIKGPIWYTFSSYLYFSSCTPVVHPHMMNYPQKCNRSPGNSLFSPLLTASRWNSNIVCVWLIFVIIFHLYFFSSPSCRFLQPWPSASC